MKYDKQETFGFLTIWGDLIFKKPTGHHIQLLMIRFKIVINDVFQNSEKDCVESSKLVKQFRIFGYCGIILRFLLT